MLKVQFFLQLLHAPSPTPPLASLCNTALWWTDARRHSSPNSHGVSLSVLFVQCAQSELDGDTVKTILAEYKIHNADITLRSDVTADDLIDVVEGNR